MRKRAITIGLIFTFSSSIQSQSTNSYHEGPALNASSQWYFSENNQELLKARNSYSQGRLVDCYSHYSKVIHKRYLIEGEDYLKYAHALHRVNKFDSAMYWTKKYLAMEPRSEQAQNLLHQLQFNTGHYDDSFDPRHTYPYVEQESEVEGTLLVVNASGSSKSYVLTEDQIIEIKGSGYSEEWIYTLLEKNAIRINGKITLNPFWYQPGQVNLDESSRRELQKLAKLMKKYELVEFEIRSHAHESGSDLFNQRLSQARAKAARDFLLNQEIQTERLLAIGYGEQQSCAEECNDQERELNQRTEFRLVYIDHNQVVSNY